MNILITNFINDAVCVAITSMVFTILIIPILIQLSNHFKIYDMPNHRKQHTVPIPTFGGIALFIGIVSSVVLWVDIWSNVEVLVLLACLVSLFITGFFDDLIDLSALVKFGIQFLTAFCIALIGIRVESLNGFFGIYELQILQQYILTVFIIVGITNAINLLDGIDGLAGGITLINSIVLFVAFYFIDNTVYTLLALAIVGALAGFLHFNFFPAKIYMGDTGSLVLGFLLAVISLKYLQETYVGDNSSFILIVGILILPVIDTLRVFIVRMLNGKSPFKADKNHIHHLLVQTGFDHKRSAMLLYFANVILVIISIVLGVYNIQLEVAVIVLIGATIFLTELITIKRLLGIRTRVRNIVSNQVKRSASNYLLLKLNQT